MGYTCSNANDDLTHPRAADNSRRGFDGLVGAYIGLGIDEYGNFLNQGDNTASGFGYQWDRIGLRGTGSVAWRALHALNSTYYPSSLYTTASGSTWLSDLAVQNTCKTGYLWNYSNPNAPVQTTTPVADYNAIPNGYSVLTGVQIANEAAANRTQATPITYKLKITSAGLLSFSYSIKGGAYVSVLTKQNITTSNGAQPASYLFGFTGSTGGSTNVHEILCFQARPADATGSSAGDNQVQSSKLLTGAQGYFAQYDPNTWAGSLAAYNLIVTDPVNQLVSVATPANWDSSCVLTGVATGESCAATGVAGPSAAQAPAARSILTYSGSSGIAFEWANLTAAEQTAIDLGDATPTTNRVNYLRGDRTNEVTPLGTGLYRDRASVLGDIIDSSPTWVGPPSSPYKTSFQDLLYPTTDVPSEPVGSYQSFITSAGTRQNVVYIGANDGLLHGFRAGAYDVNGNFVADVTTPNDGSEAIAYMPYLVVNDIHSNTNPSIDYANPAYSHAYYVDATPGVGDLYYSGAWHTWIVSGLGAGGADIFALDITNPSTFGEANAAATVIGDWTSATITCVNAAGCGANLGQTFGTPQIRRFHNGQWGAVFGNGFNSSTGNAGIFVMLVNQAGGSPTFYYLQAPAGVGGNGIAYVTPVDLDGDHITDYVYAGDLAGNVWRFNLTSNTPGNWASGATPLFSTPAGQPITTQLVVAGVPSPPGPTRVIIAFGTGQQTPITPTQSATYAGGAQYLYGIWDWNYNDWNSKSTTRYASLAGPQTVTTANLQPQTVTGTYAPAQGDTIALGYRTVSSNAVCWAGTSSCTASNNQFGWSMLLPGSGEQTIYNPALMARCSSSIRSSRPTTPR